MIAIGSVFGLLLGRAVYNLPALIGLLFAIVVLRNFEVSFATAFLILLASTGISLITVCTLSLLAPYLSSNRLPTSWLAAVSMAGFALAFQDGVLLEGIATLASIDAEQGGSLLLLTLRMVNGVVFAATGLCLLFCAFLLVIEIPFVLGTRLGGVVTPEIVSTCRPILIFFAIAVSMDLLGAFLLRESPLITLLIN